MIAKKTLLFFFMLAPFLVLAQPDTSQVVVFKVKQKKFTVNVSPPDTVFWTDRINPIQVRIANGGKIDRVTINNGRVFRLDSVHFEVRVRSGNTAVLSVYRRLPDGVSRLAYTQKYRVRSIPVPTVKICEVGHDSIIDPKQMIEYGTLSAEIKGFEMLMPLEIESFTMIVVTHNSVDTLRTIGNRFSLPMRRKIHMLKPGHNVYFQEIWCTTPDGKRRLAQPVHVSIDETNRYTVGYRVVAASPE